MEIDVTMPAMDPLFGKVLYYAVKVRVEKDYTVLTECVEVTCTVTIIRKLVALVLWKDYTVLTECVKVTCAVTCIRRLVGVVLWKWYKRATSQITHWSGTS